MRGESGSPLFRNKLKGVALMSLIALATYHWKGFIIGKMLKLRLGVYDIPGQNGLKSKLTIV